MKTLNGLYLILGGASHVLLMLLVQPSCAEVVAGSVDELETLTSPQTVPVIMPMPKPSAVIPPYAQNDPLLRRAISFGDPVLKRMIEDQIRKPGGLNNLKEVRFRKNIEARLDLILRQANRPPAPRILPIPKQTEDSEFALEKEISRLESQIANLENIIKRNGTRETLPSQNFATGLSQNGNSMMSLLAMMSQMNQFGQLGSFNQGFPQLRPMPNVFGNQNLFGNQPWFNNNQNSGAMFGGPNLMSGYNGGFNNYNSIPSVLPALQNINNYGFGSQMASLNGSYGFNSNAFSTRPYMTSSLSMRPSVPSVLPFVH